MFIFTIAEHVVMDAMVGRSLEPDYPRQLSFVHAIADLLCKR